MFFTQWTCPTFKINDSYIDNSKKDVKGYRNTFFTILKNPTKAFYLNYQNVYQLLCIQLSDIFSITIKITLMNNINNDNVKIFIIVKGYVLYFISKYLNYY